MRKCQLCGYLVLHEGEICKHCGALLPRVSAFATIGGPPPPAPAHAPAPSAARDAMPPTSASFADPPAERAHWDPPSPMPVKTRRRTPRAVITFIAIAAMALGWITVGGFIRGDRLPAGTKAFVAGHGVPFSSPDHSFDVEFPQQPTLIQKTFPVASTASTLNLAQAQTHDYEVVAASMVVPIRVSPAEVDAAMNQIVEAGADSQDADITSKKKVTIEGAPGVEVRAKLKDGYSARILVVVSGSHFYMLGVHSRSATSRLYDALLASLVIY
jgi:hypothetical protein